jgi:hypothetical protein
MYCKYLEALNNMANTMNGTLMGLSSGEYEIQYDNGGSSDPLSCGSSLEVYEDGHWLLGKLAYSNSKGGYYIFNDKENPALYSTMKVKKIVS